MQKTTSLKYELCLNPSTLHPIPDSPHPIPDTLHPLCSLSLSLVFAPPLSHSLSLRPLPRALGGSVSQPSCLCITHTSDGSVTD